MLKRCEFISVNNPFRRSNFHKWFSIRANISTKKRNNAGLPNLEAQESVCLLVYTDKKYRAEDKKVVFITNCLPAIPASVERDCHRKNIRDEDRHYTRKLIASPPVFKAYNYCKEGVDKHDRLCGQHSIPLTTVRGYMKVFYRLLDSAGCSIKPQDKKRANGIWPHRRDTHLPGSKSPSSFHYVVVTPHVR